MEDLVESILDYVRADYTDFLGEFPIYHRQIKEISL